MYQSLYFRHVKFLHLSYRNTAIARFQNSSNGICNHRAFKLKLLLPLYLVIDNFCSIFNKCMHLKYLSYRYNNWQCTLHKQPNLNIKCVYDCQSFKQYNKHSFLIWTSKVPMSPRSWQPGTFWANTMLKCCCRIYALLQCDAYCGTLWQTVIK